MVIGDGVAGTAAAWRACAEIADAQASEGAPSARAGAPSERSGTPSERLGTPSGRSGTPSQRGGAPSSRRPSGTRVTVISAGAGASVLASGAVDDAPWEDVLRAATITGIDPRARELPAGVIDFAEALGSWRIAAAGEPLPRLATIAGRTRPARGHDRALLDLATIPAQSTVLVPRVDRATWDADALAAAWNDDTFARRRELRFVALDVDLLRFAEEHRIPDADLAARHDEHARLVWLADRLREATTRAGLSPRAAIFGPWLGLESARAEELSRITGLVAGEALTGMGGSAGLRFMDARDRLLGALGAERVTGRVTRITARDPSTNRPSVTVDGLDERIPADRIILAGGGLAGGALVYDPLDIHAGADMAERNAPPFRLSFEVEAPLAEQPHLAAHGARIGVSSSMFGPDLEQVAWPAPGRQGLLEAVGVACTPEGLATPYLAVAGDSMADCPRTTLVAVSSGLVAGAWATRPD